MPSSNQPMSVEKQNDTIALIRMIYCLCTVCNPINLIDMLVDIFSFGNHECETSCNSWHAARPSLWIGCYICDHPGSIHKWLAALSAGVCVYLYSWITLLLESWNFDWKGKDLFDMSLIFIYLVCEYVYKDALVVLKLK